MEHILSIGMKITHPESTRVDYHIYCPCGWVCKMFNTSGDFMSRAYTYHDATIAAKIDNAFASEETDKLEVGYA